MYFILFLIWWWDDIKSTLLLLCYLYPLCNFKTASSFIDIFAKLYCKQWVFIVLLKIKLFKLFLTDETFWKVVSYPPGHLNLSQGFNWEGWWTLFPFDLVSWRVLGYFLCRKSLVDESVHWVIGSMKPLVFYTN